MNKRIPNAFKPYCNAVWLALGLTLPVLPAPVHAAEATLTSLTSIQRRIGNLDGPLATASWAHGALMVTADRDGWLVAETLGNTIRHISQNGQVLTLAGLSGEQGKADGPGHKARFYHPERAVRGPDGKVYVADSSNNAIRVIDPQGNVSTLKTRPASKKAEDDLAIESPRSLAFDHKGTLWVLQNASVPIVTISPDGKQQAWQPTAEAAGWEEWVDLTADAQGQIWALTRTELYRLTPDGKELVASDKRPTWELPAVYQQNPPNAGPVSARLGEVPFHGRNPLPPPPEMPPEFIQPEFMALTVAPDGTAYVADRDRILELPVGQKKLVERFTKPINPLQLDDQFTTLAHNGQTLLASTNTEGLYRLNRQYQSTPFARALPMGWNVDADVQDNWLPRINTSIALKGKPNRLYAFQLDHVLMLSGKGDTLSRWAGQAQEAYYADGARLEARFHSPSDLLENTDGSILVADSGNGLIRRIRPNGQVEIVAGNGQDDQRLDGKGRNATFLNPQSLALDPARQWLYILDVSERVAMGSNIIRKLDLATSEVSTLEPQTINPKTGLKGKLQTLFEVIPQLQALKMGGKLEYTAITVDPQGTLYALETQTFSAIIWKIDPVTTRHTLHAVLSLPADTEEGFENNLLSCPRTVCLPSHLAADAYGNLYLSDAQSHTLIRVSPNGEAGIIAGKLGNRGNLPGALPGSLDGPAAMRWQADQLEINTNSGLMQLSNPHLAPISQHIASKTLPANYAMKGSKP